MAQEVERRLGKAEATGSNPVGSFREAIKPRRNKKEKKAFELAQNDFFSFLFLCGECRDRDEAKRSRGFVALLRKINKVPYIY